MEIENMASPIGLKVLLCKSEAEHFDIAIPPFLKTDIVSEALI